MFFVQCGIINANALELLETLKGRGMKGLFSECELTVFFFFLFLKLSSLCLLRLSLTFMCIYYREMKRNMHSCAFGSIKSLKINKVVVLIC